MNPAIHGYDGILSTYRYQLPNIALAGPTLFGGVLDAFNKYAAEMQGQMIYQVLLILTDGEIHDMTNVKKLIVDSSPLPTSVIIVGVGNEDFDMMVELDSDEVLLKDDEGRDCTRDIVQFVKFNECIKQGTLAEEVLKEIPDQVCLFMEQNNIKPVIPVHHPAGASYSIDESAMNTIAGIQ